MTARLRSWREQIQKYRKAIGVVAIVLIVVVVIVLIFVGYWSDWTGFNGYNQVTIAHTTSGPSAGTVVRTEVYQPGKALWDWLQLLIIPFVLAVGGYVFNLTVSRNEQKRAQLRDQTEREIALDNQHEAALQEYIDKMSELLLEKKLRDSAEDDEVRKIARVRTLAVLPRLDKGRKKSVLLFLHESGLIDKDKRIIALRGADLSEADLSGADLHGDHLGGVNLRKADLRKADLRDIILRDEEIKVFSASESGYTFADLRGADLRNADLGGADLTGALLDGANLSEASLHGADLSGTDLRGADLHGTYLRAANLFEGHITPEQEKMVSSLKRATMPDGSIHS